MVEKQLDNFEDPLILTEGALTTEPSELNENKFVRFSINDANLFTNQSEVEKENRKIIKDDIKPVEFRLLKMKKSVTRSMKVV